MVAPWNESEICRNIHCHEVNYKDEILIHHLMQVCPWKARHGNVKAAWKKVLDGLLLEKIDGNFMFAGINVMTIRNRYQIVYLVLGDKWRKEREQHNVEEASEDEELENRNERTTKQLIKQGIEDLYKDHIQHEEEVQEQKSNDKEKEEKGKIVATCIKEAALGHLQQRQSTQKVAPQRQTRSKSKKVLPRRKKNWHHHHQPTVGMAIPHLPRKRMRNTLMRRMTLPTKPLMW